MASTTDTQMMPTTDIHHDYGHKNHISLNPRSGSDIASEVVADQKTSQVGDHVEAVDHHGEENLTYDDDEAPELHFRTYMAIMTQFFMLMAMTLCLQGPSAVLSTIETSLDNTAAGTWIPNSMSLVQAALGPLWSSASDAFQARKAILVGTATVSFIGCCIAPGSTDIYRLIAAQTLIGFCFSAAPITYCIPSEVVPRRWRPLAQAFLNLGSISGSITGPLVIGALTQRDPQNGWRNFYWFQAGLWAFVALATLFGYRPPKRYGRLYHLPLSDKLARLDIPGMLLFLSGLALFLAGMSLGGGLYPWVSAPVLAPIIVGGVVLICFGVYEWKFTKVGILHHDMFRGGKGAGRTFALCILLIFLEGVLLFTFVIFYPILTGWFYEQDPFKIVSREMPFWVCAGLSTVVYGWTSSRLRSVREPMFVGFLIYTAGIIGLATLQPNPGDSTRAVVFAGLAGLGFGAPFILIIVGTHCSVPHYLIATATAITNSGRAIGAAVFTASYSAALQTGLANKIPAYVGKVAQQAGLAASNIPAFIEGISADDVAALAKIPGATASVISSGMSAFRQAEADSIRVVFIIAVPFGVAGCIACLFLGDLKATMTYRVDAPLENLHAKHYGHHEEVTGA